MKMGKIEKLFVNSATHSRQVSQHFERLLQKIEVRAGQRYLDVGCGNGVAPIHIARTYDLDVTGVDVDAEQIELARRHAQGQADVRFLTQDGTRLPFLSHDFDIVATNKVMHHIPNWPDAFAEMVRVLKPGGYLIYADLVTPVWVAVIGQSVVKKQMGFPTTPAVNRLARRCGLADVYVSTSALSYEAVWRKGIC